MKNILFSFCFVLVASITFSQNDSTEFNRFKKEYDDYIKKETAAFEKYKEDRDKEFAEFLKADWENFQLFASGKPIELPGPDKIPVFDKKKELGSAKKMPTKNITEILQPTVDESSFQLRPIPALMTPESKKDYDLVSITFYGSKLNFMYHKKMSAANISAVSESQIANYWSDISASDYYRLVEQMLDYKNSNNLNDFAYMKLAEQISATINKNPNNAKLMTWFLLAKSGYKLKVGYSGSSVHLLVPVVNIIYSYSYFVFENMKYYIFEEETQVKSIYTYRQDYPEANRIMNFNIYKAPTLGPEILSRNLNFNYEDKSYNFAIKYSKNLIEFYDDYPQGEIQIFFNAGISRYAKESLDRSLDSLVSTMEEVAAANFLLSFVQNAFSYKTDNEQFGREKFFFPEEILHYAYCDCEDRSVFYSYLINEYLRLPVAGLNYPEHIATAVRFTENIPGSYFLIDNERFVICDPTYINAPVGACMPDYAKSEVTIVRLKNTQVSNSAGNVIWNALTAKGFTRTNYENDMVKFDEKTWYVTGIMDSLSDTEGKKVKLSSNGETIFFAKIDETGKIKSIETITGEGLLMPIGIAVSQYGIYISGYYSISIKSENTEIKAVYDRELFLACYDFENKLQWLRASGIVNELETSNMFFAVNLDKKGNYTGKESISEQSYESQNAIDLSDSEKIVVYLKLDGTMSQLIDAEVYSNPGSFEFASALKKLITDLNSKSYNQNSAGLTAFLKILQNGNISLTGKEITAATITINTGFKEAAPKLYSALKEITEISSKNGIVTLKLKNPTNFSPANLKFDPVSQFRILNYKSGNLEIIVLSGIAYQPFVKIYPVNYFKIFKSSDDITIDYDSDNDQKVINISKDLLK